MPATTTHPQSAWAGISFTGLRSVVVSMIFLSSFYVVFEPAICDLCLFASFILFFGSGLRITPAIMPLFSLLLIYNVAGLISYIQIADDRFSSYIYLIGLAYTSVSAVFIAAYITADPAKRYLQIEKAYWIGATIGGVLGLITYLGTEPFASYLPTYYARAIGGYKDPNVFSTWLVFPAVSMVQAFLVGRLRLSILSILSFLIIFGALFLAFSRGAWISTIVASVLTIIFTLVLSPTKEARQYVAVSTFIVIIVIAAIVAILLSIPAIRDVFLDRFTLVKSYDGAETGRFGNQLNAIPMLIPLPFGWGPYQFVTHFTNAPHNTFLNAFSSAGWLGGLSYLTFMMSNFYAGFKSILVRSPFQPFAIISFSCVAALTIQAMQIDMEHWRHFYWAVGMTWGFFAASLAYQKKPAKLFEIAESWQIKRRYS
jgi:O-Antigen ligase